MRRDDHNLFLKNNPAFSDFVQNLEATTRTIRSELINKSLSLLFHSLQHREKIKFQNQATPCKDLQINDVVFSRIDFIDTGSLGLSIMRVFSLNKAQNQAIVAKPRPANSEEGIFKKPLILTRAVDQLYLIVSSKTNNDNINRDNEKTLNIPELIRVRDVKIGSIIDPN